MGKLLEVYEAMSQPVDQSVEKTAEVQEVEARMEVLHKYAAAADEILAKEKGENYTEDDVVKLASELIENDAEALEMSEVIDFYKDAGTIMAQAFKEELAKTEA